MKFQAWMLRSSPAGAYVFKVYESFGDRKHVQIFNVDETYIFTTILPSTTIA